MNIKNAAPVMGFSFEEPIPHNQLNEDYIGIAPQYRVSNKSSKALSQIAVSSGAVLFRPISQMTPLEKMGLIKKGISKKELEHLKNTAALDYDQLAEALAVTRATLINKKGLEKFSSSISEKIVSLADIYSFGYEVFEDEEKFNTWVFKPSRALGGQPPYTLLNNQFGREEIRNLIGRVAYGVYS
jgi:putative toxin-antitoxin system antitoxin component (TIGR02293 family)